MMKINFKHSSSTDDTVSRERPDLQPATVSECVFVKAGQTLQVLSSDDSTHTVVSVFYSKSCQ